MTDESAMPPMREQIEGLLFAVDDPGCYSMLVDAQVLKQLCDMALAALRQDGVVVPREPTDDIARAIGHQCGLEFGEGRWTLGRYKRIYLAMIAAAETTNNGVPLAGGREAGRAAAGKDESQHETAATPPDELEQLIESSLRQIFPDLCYDDGRPDLWLDAAVTLTKVHRERAERRIAELTEHSIAWRTRAVQVEARAEKAERRIAELERDNHVLDLAVDAQKQRAEKAETTIRLLTEAYEDEILYVLNHGKRSSSKEAFLKYTENKSE